MSIHIHPTAELAERVLLPGDPGRALRLATELIDGPKMFNHNRGLWGYTGPARADGAPLTIQSTGMGGPSAAIVIHELISLGARRLVRIGTSGGLDPTLELGQLLVATEAVADDGTSRALGAGERVAGSPELLAALLGAAGAPAGDVASDDAGGPTVAGHLGRQSHPRGNLPATPPGPLTATTSGPLTATTSGPLTATTSGPIVSTDLFYDADDRLDAWRELGARAVEMETATLFILAARANVTAGAVVIVSDLLTRPGGPVRIDADALTAAESRLGHTAVAALVG